MARINAMNTRLYVYTWLQDENPMHNEAILQTPPVLKNNRHHKVAVIPLIKRVGIIFIKED